MKDIKFKRFSGSIQGFIDANPSRMGSTAVSRAAYYADEINRQSGTADKAVYLGVDPGSRRVRGISGKLPNNPLWLFDGAINTNDGTRVDAITDQVGGVMSFAATGENRFEMDGMYPQKNSMLNQTMTLSPLYTLNKDQYSVILCVRVVGGSVSYPIIAMATSSRGGITGVSTSAQYSLLFGSNPTNETSTIAVSGAYAVNPNTFPYNLVVIFSYDKTTSDNRSIYVWHKVDGTDPVISNEVYKSNDNIDTPIYGIGRNHTSNASLFTFYSMSAYDRVLSLEEQEASLRYLVDRYSL